ncbi:unnamed protein product [Brassica oleracea]
MGEEGEINEFFSENTAMVFWNMDDYPIPAAGIDDLGFIRTNIEEVLHRMGFHGYKEIDVYCKRIQSDVQQELSEARIFYLPSSTRIYITTGGNKSAPVDMTSFLVHSALTISGPNGPLDLVVIAKATPKGELDRVIKCLESRGHTILLIDTTAIRGSFFNVESLLGCARMLRPRPPTRSDLSEGEEEIEEDSSEGEEEFEEDPSYVRYSSKIVDFREPIRPVKENRTGVFWEAEDFPFPPFSSPDEIYGKIKSALWERGFTNKLSIWVYLDDNKKGTWRDVLLGDKVWASRIYFLPGGDKASRRIRMANDICFWARDFPYKRSKGIVFLFSDQFKDDAEYTEMLQNLVSVSCYVRSIIPTQDSNKPESPNWPGLLIDGGGGYWVDY